MLDLDPEQAGVLPQQWIAKAVAEGCIVSTEAPVAEVAANIQPASLDLTLGPVAHRLRCSFLPDRETVEAKLDTFGMEAIDLTSGAILERNRPYLIPLREELRLPPSLRARANPKSSTGRLDIFTRVITDRSYLFDEIAHGYRGRLWLEVVSRSFTVKVRTGLSLNQLRLVWGSPRVSDDAIRALHADGPILFRRGRPVGARQLAVSNGLFLSLDLDDKGGEPVGYRARKNSALLDLSNENFYAAEDYWEPVHPESRNRVVLEPEEFYLLLSDEAVRIPPDHAGEMTAYDPTSGELRTHYAGFFDPGFGHDDAGLRGSRATLEVRAHDVPFVVESGQRVCKLSFERMYEPPTTTYGQDMNSNYQSQVVTLSKHFRIAPPVKQPRLRWGP